MRDAHLRAHGLALLGWAILGSLVIAADQTMWPSSGFSLRGVASTAYAVFFVILVLASTLLFLVLRPRRALSVIALHAGAAVGTVALALGGLWAAGAIDDSQRADQARADAAEAARVAEGISLERWWIHGEGRERRVGGVVRSRDACRITLGYEARAPGTAMPVERSALDLAPAEVEAGETHSFEGHVLRYPGGAPTSESVVLTIERDGASAVHIWYCRPSCGATDLGDVARDLPEPSHE